MKFEMVCNNCGSIHSDESGLYQCPFCKGAMTIRYMENGLARKEGDRTQRWRGMWMYKESLPIVSDHPVTLGEGATPLVFLENWSGLATNVYAKTETTNPTGTYKDRPASVSVSRAKELGARGVTVASDGNAAPAVAAFAARAGLPCVVFMPRETPKERCIQTAAFGALILLLEGNINDCLDQAAKAAKAFNLHNCSTTQGENPYQVEGDKTIAFEIVDQLGFCPDWVAVPIGGGSLLTGVVKGMAELREAGRIKSMPRILAVQAEACAPFVRAFQKGEPVRREEHPRPTLALTIAVPYPPDNVQAMKALKSVNGDAVAVSEDDLSKTVLDLSTRYGVLAEPSGAASLAGVSRRGREGFFSEGETVVSVITGTGLKSLGIFAGELQEKGWEMPTLPNDERTVHAYLKTML